MATRALACLAADVQPHAAAELQLSLQTYLNQTYPNRAQSYTNLGYRYGYTGPATNPYSGNGYSRNSYSGPQAYAARPGFAYTNPSQSYRAPQSNRSYQNYGNTMARNERSGGFSSQRALSTVQGLVELGGGHQNLWWWTSSRQSPEFLAVDIKAHPR